MINISIKGTQLELTPAIKAHTEEKVAMVERYLDARDTDPRVDVELEHAPRHQSGPVFRAEMNLHTAHTQLRTESTQEDLYAAIDVAKDDLVAQLREIKAKETSQVRRGGRMFKAIMQKMGWGE